MTKVLQWQQFLFHPSNLQHLRLPFSFFLLPVFLFATCAALAVSEDVMAAKVLVIFVVLHVFVYPASNAFNSFYDKDEGSIGGIKTPPKVQPGLWWLSLFFDVLGLLLASLVSAYFFVGTLLYIVASRAYSHPIIRLKARPVAGWLTVFIFQGGFVFLSVLVGLLGPAVLSAQWQSWLLPALASSFLFGGAYPITQIYQHKEDGERGDLTLSLVLGVRGTFIFAFLMSFLGQILLLSWVLYSLPASCVLVVVTFAMYPAIRFQRWWGQVNIDRKAVNFDNTHSMSQVSSWAMNGMFASLVVCCLVF
jgi:hypothetical protein